MNHLTPWFQILFSTILFLIMLMKIGKRFKAGSVSNLPPGPWKLPIIGNMHQMVGLPHRVLRGLARKHGPLMHLQLGELSIIVVSSPEVAKEIFKTHDINFSSRPTLLATEILSYGSRDIAFSPHGEYWRQVRKICSQELLSVQRIRDFHPLREEEIGNLVKWIATKAGSPVNLTERVSWTNYTITSRSAFGGKLKDQGRLITVVIEYTKLLVGFNISDLFPSAKWIHFVSGTKMKLERLHRITDQILEDIIAEHRGNKAQMSASGKEAEEDLVDVLLKFEGSMDNQFSLSTDSVKSIILDVFAAGSETAATTVDWAMVEMIRNPSILQRAQNEARQAFEKRGKFDEVTLSKLHYLKLIIKETLRLHSPAPLLLPRECGETCQINGYSIPSKAKVIVNGWAMGRDPLYWTNPETFSPERFSDVTLDYKGNDFQYIPFGAGRRICPGMPMAIANVQLFLAMLLYHFDWKLPTGKKIDDLNMDESYGVTARRKDDLFLIPTIYKLG